MQVVAYLRQHASPDDLVLASPQIAWAVPAFGVDFGALDVYENTNGQYIFPSSLFIRPITLDDTAYAILDPLARDFAPLVLPGMEGVIKEVEGWPVVLKAGEIEVYKRPLE